MKRRPPDVATLASGPVITVVGGQVQTNERGEPEPYLFVRPIRCVVSPPCGHCWYCRQRERP